MEGGTSPVPICIARMICPCFECCLCCAPGYAPARGSDGVDRLLNVYPYCTEAGDFLCSQLQHISVESDSPAPLRACSMLAIAYSTSATPLTRRAAAELPCRAGGTWRRASASRPVGRCGSLACKARLQRLQQEETGVQAQQLRPQDANLLGPRLFRGACLCGVAALLSVAAPGAAQAAGDAAASSGAGALLQCE